MSAWSGKFSEISTGGVAGVLTFGDFTGFLAAFTLLILADFGRRVDPLRDFLRFFFGLAMNTIFSRKPWLLSIFYARVAQPTLDSRQVL